MAPEGAPLQSHIATAHEKLEARLVAAIEAQHTSLLKAIAGLIEARPFCFSDNDGLASCASRGDLMSSMASAEGPDDGPCVGLLQEELLPHDAEEPDEDDNFGARVELQDATQVISRRKSDLLEGESSAIPERRSSMPPSSGCRLDGCLILQRISSCAVSIKQMRGFEALIAIMILANAASIGLSADYSIKNPGEDIPTYFRTFDYVFLFVFSVELVLRILENGFLDFYRPGNPSFGWNVFDTLLIGASFVNESAFGLNLSVIRVFRILRLVNVMRMIRLMKMFKELRLMVSGIMNCGKTMLWAILLLTIVSYIYAVFCLQIAAEWLGAAPENSGPAQRAQFIEVQVFVDKHFPSVVQSIYTLFKTVTGGLNWGEVADPFESISVPVFISFPLYIVVTVFCVLNIITAAFVEAAQRTSQEEDTNALESIEERELWIGKILELFKKHDVDSDGTLVRDEFTTVMSDWRTQEYFTRIGLTFDFENIEQMFKLFDWDGDGTIDLNEFAQGVHHLRGNARSLDMFREFSMLNRKLDRGLRRMERAVSRRPAMSRAMSLCRAASAGQLCEEVERVAPSKLADVVVS